MSADAGQTVVAGEGEVRARSWWTGWGALLGGAVYGVLLVLAFPPVGAWPLAFGLVVPLALVASRAGERPVRAGLLVALGSLPAWLFEHLWLIDVTAPGFPLLSLGLAAFTGAFVAIVALACARLGSMAPVAVVVPVVWTGLEFVRGEIAFTGYPWFLAAHPLIEAPALAAPASWLGTYFVSFLVAAVAGAGVALLRGTAQGRRLALGMLALVAGVWVAGGATTGPRPARTGNAAGDGAIARIAVVQTNLEQSNKMDWSLAQRLEDWATFAALTWEAAALGEGTGGERVDLIAWPETMFPGDALNPEALNASARAGLYWPPVEPGGPRIYNTHFAEELLELQGSLGVPLLVGATALDGVTIQKGEGAMVKIDYRARYNSAFVVSGGTVRAERYDKMHLTPFGEVIPYVWRWPAVQQAFLDLGAAGMAFNLVPGRKPRVFSLELVDGELEEDGDGGGGGAAARTLRFATPICFEATMPAVCRRLAYDDGRLAVDVLINLSNDGWFGAYRAGREQHLQVSRWRCVELGVPMVRAVNTGISASIDRHGRVLAAGPAGRDRAVDVDGVLVAEVELTRASKDGAGGTMYGRTGEWFSWVMLAGTGLVVVGSAAAGRGAKGKRGAESGGAGESGRRSRTARLNHGETR